LMQRIRPRTIQLLRLRKKFGLTLNK
jgi:hypothetical protein